MRFLRTLAKERKLRTNASIGLLLFFALIFAGIGGSHKTFNSVEVAFTDNSQSGLSIVPASCPSSPGDTDAPYGCSGSLPLCQNGSAAPNGDVSQCTCAQGNVAACLFCPNGSLAPNNVPSQCTCAQGNTNACARCPDGSMAPNNDANQCTCLQGNISACTTRCPDGTPAPGGNAAQCTCAQGNTSACTSSACPTGYTQTTLGQCVFSGCPSGYVLQGNACILNSCGPDQHAVGSVCVCNATNLLADANGKCTSQVCPSGFQYDPGTGKCIAISQCTLPPVCSDTTHALNRCTGAVTNCALNGSGWICQNGSCIQSPPPIASIIVSARLVSPGTSVTVSWSSQNTTDCSVTGNNGDGAWSGTAGSRSSKPIQAQTIYTLTCHGIDGSTITKSTTINIIPVVIET